jgi:hypothetical protein
MAYALQFDGVDDHVTLSSMVGGAFADRVNVNQDWSLTFRFARAGTSSYVHRLLSSTNGSTDELLMRASDGLFRVTGLSGSHSWSGVPMPTTETEYRLERVVGTKQLELFVDSVSQGTTTGVVTIFNFDVVGVKGASGYVNGTLYYLSYDSVNSGASLYLDPSATGGTGSILEDTEGTNNGTLVNFPTDDSQWVFYSDTTAIELTPTTINSNSQSFNPLIQYASLLSLAPGVVDSASSSLNPVIQYSASLNIFPNTVDSSSISLNPIVKYIAALDLLPGAINSNSVSLDPIVNYTSILNISPSVANSNSVSFNPSIDYTSALIISPVTVDSSSVSLDPLVEYKIQGRN